MSHAVSMCAVAALLYAWAATRDRRTLWQWAVVGALGGLAMTMRWQNVVFVLVPAFDLAADVWKGRTAGREVLIGAVRAAMVFGVAMVAGFLPQMLTWQAMYGVPLGVSPLSPKMFWGNPAIVGVLWSSQNGLFSTSPIMVPAALGVLVLVRKAPRFGWVSLVAIALAVYINASVEDWGGGAAYGPRRFDGAVPMLVAGLASSIEWLRTFVARRPFVAVTALLLTFVVWNATFMAVMLTGQFGLSSLRPFAAVSAAQAARLHGWIGHPFSYPANLWFAVRNRVAPSRFDTLFFQFLGEPERPYGKVDIGGNDEDYLLDGWYGAESDPDGTTWRWTAEESGVLIPLDHVAPLLLQARVVPFTSPAFPQALVGVVVNGHPFGPVPVTPGGWQRIEIPVPASAWTPGVNRVVWRWLSSAVPAEVGAGADPRRLGARVDFVRVQVAQ